MKRRKGAIEQSPFHGALNCQQVRTIPPSVKGRQGERNESIDRRVILLCPLEYVFPPVLISSELTMRLMS
jgi:hypothetical protein